MSIDRRTFLQLLTTGALSAAFPPSIARALSIPAHCRNGTINDVEHIVIMMQENRSFDHYYGTLRGVRGYGDNRTIDLPDGNPVWYQPNNDGYLLPFHPGAPNLGLQFIEDLAHDWTSTHAAWNLGKYDQWVPNKGTTTMAHLVRSDIPFHYALADAFTICDAYHFAPDTELSDRWNLRSRGETDYHLSVFGPNGFLRVFKGSTVTGRANIATSLIYDVQGDGVILGIHNHTTTESEVKVSDRYTHQTIKLRLEPNGERREFWSLDGSYGWYDLTITTNSDSRFQHRLAGHLETGRDSMSDPAIGCVHQLDQLTKNDDLAKQRSKL